jgi:hypothetical protein
MHNTYWEPMHYEQAYCIYILHGITQEQKMAFQIHYTITARPHLEVPGSDCQVH